MNRARHHSFRPCELTFPGSAVDLLATVILVFAVNEPAFHVSQQRLPGLKLDTGSAASSVNSGGAYRVDLKADGSVYLEGQRIAPQDLPRRIAADAHTDRPIRLNVETTADGRGPLDAWLQLQVDLTNAKVWNRVQVSTRSSKSGNSPGGQP